MKQSQELTRVNPDRNIFSKNVDLTSTFFTLKWFGLSPSPNFRSVFDSSLQSCMFEFNPKVCFSRSHLS